MTENFLSQGEQDYYYLFFFFFLNSNEMHSMLHILRLEVIALYCNHLFVVNLL